TLRYRVEQVFLIHTETSLLLRHAALPSLADADEDADIVSSMLSAVQTFVRDSFHVDDSEALDALQMGDLTVWLVPGPEAVLAAVIRGTPPQELRLLLAEGIETVHRRHARDLAAFEGDVDPFEAADPVLYDLLVEQRKEDDGISPMAWVLLVVLAALLGWWGWTTFDRMQRWQATLADLDTLAGLDVITEDRTWGAYRLVGLRDPDAPQPDSVLARHGFAVEALADSLDLDAVRMRWLPYQSDSPPIVAQRAARLLAAPPSVALTVRGDTLVGTGAAERPWLAAAPDAIRFVPGVQALDFEAVQTRTEVAAVPVEAAVIRFGIDNELAAGEDAVLAALVADVQALAEATVEDDRPIVLALIGHTDGTGSAARNQRLSLRRAAVVRDALAPALAEADLADRVTLRLVAAGDAFQLDEGESLRSRRVTFEVQIEDVTAQQA
ncbi:MAG: OmpA family protein, partial [Bacteroidota bacterium]